MRVFLPSVNFTLLLMNLKVQSLFKIRLVICYKPDVDLRYFPNNASDRLGIDWTGFDKQLLLILCKSQDLALFQVNLSIVTLRAFYSDALDLNLNLDLDLGI